MQGQKVTLKFHESLDKILQDGAELGWVFPLEYPLRSYVEVIKNPASQEEKDNLFVEYFNSDFEKTIKNPILQYSSTAPTHLKTLLHECFASYESGHYQICIPALFSTLEGLLTELSNGHNRKETRYKDGIDKKIKILGSSPKSLPLKSIAYFLELVMCTIDFNGEEVYTINRHWSQHGRYISELPPKAPLQLFNAVALVLFSKHFIAQE